MGRAIEAREPALQPAVSPSPAATLSHQDGSHPPAARRMVLAATIIASAMAFIDSSVVTIALPAIQAEFAATLRQLQWVVNGYTLMLGALLLVGGGLGDRIGRKRLFAAGIVVFALASILCALAPSAEVLIAGRVLKGLGAAALVPQSLAIISATHPRAIRGAAIGAWAAASAITTALGPALGGFLVDAWSWRAAFWINVPLSAAALWLTWRYMPETRSDAAEGPLDWAGAALAVASLGALTIGLTLLSDANGAPWAAYLWIALGAAGAIPFLLAERRAANPIMPLSLFRSRVFTAANLITLFLYGAMSGVLFLLPFELIERRGHSAAVVGLVLLPIGLVIGVLSRPAGRAADRLGPRLFLAAGSLLVAVAAAALSLGAPGLWLGVVAPILCLAFGMAAVVSPLTTAVMNAVPDSRSGAASGVNNAASRVAGLLAVAVLGAVAGGVFAAAAPGAGPFGVLPPPADPARAAAEAAFMSAYGAAMRVAAAWALIAAGLAWLMLRRPER